MLNRRMELGTGSLLDLDATATLALADREVAVRETGDTVVFLHRLEPGDVLEGAQLGCSGHRPRREGGAEQIGVADVRTQAVMVTATDGMQIPTQLFLPRDLKAGERRPALIFFHGGSRRQMLLTWHYNYYYRNAYAMNQWLASQGYIVLSVNYRSGIGYGNSFRRAPNTGHAFLFADGPDVAIDALWADEPPEDGPQVVPTEEGRVIVTVQGADGTPLPNTRVEFRAAPGSGQAQTAFASTDVNGLARTMWTLGPAARVAWPSRGGPVATGSPRSKCWQMPVLEPQLPTRVAENPRGVRVPNDSSRYGSSNTPWPVDPDAWKITSTPC
mgnify:CR=1 FL=1